MAVFDPNKMASFRGDEDPESPTTIIFKQMQAQGIPLNAGNIQKFVSQMGRQPNEAGPDMAPGLRVERQDAGDDSAPKTGGRTPPPAETGRSSDVSGPGAVNQANTTTDDKNAGTSAQPPPTDLPIDPMSGATSAAGPGGVDTGLGPGGKMGLGAMILAGAQAIPGLIDRFRGTPSPLVASPPQLALPAPDAQGPVIHLPDQSAPAPTTPMESAMQKATAPPEADFNKFRSLGLAPDPSGGVPIDPAKAALDNLAEERIRTGIQPPPAMPPQIPEVPFKSNPANRVRVPDANVTVRPRAVPLRGLHIS